MKRGFNLSGLVKKVRNWFKKLLNWSKKEKMVKFPDDDQIEYKKLEKWQYYLAIDDNINYWRSLGKEISKLQSGWELGYYKLKEVKNT